MHLSNSLFYNVVLWLVKRRILLPKMSCCFLQDFSLLLAGLEEKNGYKFGGECKKT